MRELSKQPIVLPTIRTLPANTNFALRPLPTQVIEVDAVATHPVGPFNTSIVLNNQHVVASEYTFVGFSRREYVYVAYRSGATLPSVPGTYIWTRIEIDGRPTPLFIDFARNLNLEASIPSRRMAGQNPTLVYIDETARSRKEHRDRVRDLVAYWRPSCNRYGWFG